jgi:hypothetical protein
MASLDKLRDRVRAFLKPWTAGSEPMEIRRAILEEVASRVVAAGGGRRIFPFNRIGIEVYAQDAEDRAVLEGIVREAWEIDAAIADALREEGAPVPAELAVEVRVVQTPVEPNAKRYHIALDRVDAPSPSTRPQLVLTVLKGTAAQRVYSFDADRVLLGRLAEVLDADGRVKRRNDVAFNDVGDVNQTVSREHARIVWNRESRTFWVRADVKSSTRVVRDGKTIDVSPQDRQGVRLQHGDEIHLGRACLKVAIDVS